MKYTVKVRRTVVMEDIVEVDADSVVQAMDKAEETANSHLSHIPHKWVAVSVKDKSE